MTADARSGPFQTYAQGATHAPSSKFSFTHIRKTLSKMSLKEKSRSPMKSPEKRHQPNDAEIDAMQRSRTCQDSTTGSPASVAAPLCPWAMIPCNNTDDTSTLETSPANEAMPGRETDISKSTPSSSSTLIQPPASPNMRKASPLPLPAYPTPNAPWQYSHGLNANGVNNTSTDPPTPPTAAGKTSQVLAKLTSENDRLRREIKAERAAREEAIEEFQVLKGRVNRLEEQNATITHQFDTNESALTRKERRIDDLRSTLEEEVARRKRAEEREAEMGRKLGETVSQAAKEVSEAHTAHKLAESSYATISKEYTGLQRRIEILRQELQDAVKRIDAEKAIHRKQLMQLEVLLDQQRHQHEKSRKEVEELGALIQSYQQTERNVKSLEKQMQETVDEMRWVMQLHHSRESSASVAEPT